MQASSGRDVGRAPQIRFRTLELSEEDPNHGTIRQRFGEGMGVIARDRQPLSPRVRGERTGDIAVPFENHAPRQGDSRVVGRSSLGPSCKS